MHGFTKSTITDPRILKKQLKEIRKLGVAFDHEEIDEGTSAVGAPIFNHSETPVAAVVVAGPPQRIESDHGSSIVRALKETANRISSQLYSKRHEGKG
jgi:DNA-binding IclR family transcriptional regulator